MVNKFVKIVVVIFVLSVSKVAAYDLPSANTENLEVGDTSVKFDYNLVDTDLDMIIDQENIKSSIVIKEQEEVIYQEDILEGEGTFEYNELKEDTLYQVLINVPYDLLGINEVYNKEPYTIESFDITTKDSLGEITKSTGYYQSINVDYKINDPKLVDKVQLKLDDTLVDVDKDSTNYLFEELRSDTEYSLKLIINDQVVSENNIKTSDKKTPPTAHIHTTSEENPSIITDQTIEIHYDLYDYDNTFIYQETAHPRMVLNPDTENMDITNAQVGVNQVAIFDTDLSKKQSHFRITGMYDLNNDGEPENEAPFEIVELYQDVVHEINTCKDLESIGQGANYPGSTHVDAWELGDSYLLANDIDCSATSVDDPNHDTTAETTYGEDGFDPIGEWDDSGDGIVDDEEISGLSGSFNGGDFSIDGIVINRPEENFSSIFRKIADTSIVSRLYVSNAKIIGNDNASALSGVNYGRIESVFVEADIVANDYVGSIMGENYNQCVKCFSTSTVKGRNNVGGLVGVNYNYITSSASSTTSLGQTYVGGLVGQNNDGVITGSFSKGTVTSLEESNVEIVIGGFAGASIGNQSAISNSYSDVKVINKTNIVAQMGGFVGFNEGSIIDTYSTGDVKIENSNADSLIGGLIGENHGDVFRSYSLSNSDGASLIGATTNGNIGKVFASSNNCVTIGNHISGELYNVFEYIDEGCGDYQKVSAEQLNDRNWYQSELGFQESYNLDKVDEGYFPQIRLDEDVEDLADQKNIDLPSVEQ